MSLSTYLCRLTYLTTRTHIANAHSASSRARDMEWRTVAVIVLVVSLCFFIVPIKVGPDKTVEDAKLFADYIARYNKTYRNDSTEYKERFDNFQKSLRHIERLNGLRSSQESAYYGLTEFSDLSEDEFLQQTLLPDLSLRGQKHTTASYYHQHSVNSVDRMKRMIGIPSKFDWRDRGVVGPVVNQESCGACWAFSTIGVAESMYAIRNGTLYSFSVQEMIDCMPGNYGCQGGDICSLLSWLLASKTKIISENDYPLTRRTDLCRLSKITAKTSGIKITDFTCDSFIDAETELLTLLTHGPVAAAVNAISWQNYLGGVIQYHCDGSFNSLNHAIQIVGYDMRASIPHYIIKNSWGSSFGDKGYIYIAVGKNLCGIANQVSSLDVI
ncbi:cathepsin O-like isoform X1 [Pogonomyrmex barbatus]|uniref:Cathepsin O-like isoform X1 n=1 Tax=Pogonomyrmex barbatus TaxID=144034 RepID=A0A6I9XLS0_9HYME|nr:cathepsin O-like isoform X1 [Pogonomyrmex barbatus]